MQQKLSQYLWNDIGKHGFNILKESYFVTRIVGAYLSDDDFIRYLKNDIAYLDYFIKAMTILGQKYPQDQEFSEACLHFADEAQQESLSLVQDYFDGDKPTAPVDPVAVKYGEHLVNAAQNDPQSVAFAATIPCFWNYARLGIYFAENIEDMDNHPQSEWIKSYAPTLPNQPKTSQSYLDYQTPQSAQSHWGVSATMPTLPQPVPQKPAHWHLNNNDVLLASSLLDRLAEASPKTIPLMKTRFTSSVIFEQGFFNAIEAGSSPQLENQESRKSSRQCCVAF